MGDRAQPLAAHRVALVRHRARPDLLLAERLLDLAEVLEQPDVVAEFGDSFILDASESRAYGGRELVGYHWSLDEEGD